MSQERRTAGGATPLPQETVMRKAHKFPTKALGLVLALTLTLVAVGAWNAWRLYGGFQEIASNEVRLGRLSGEIMRLDEVLTMSAHMAAATGDSAWQERYERHEPELTVAIEEIIRLAPEAYEAGAAEQTRAANDKLVAMETRAFELVREGRLADARRVMVGDDYAQEKGIYAAGMEASRQSAEQRMQARGEGLRSRAVVSMGVTLGVLLLLGATWIHIVALIRKYLRARGAAEEALRLANSTLEGRVEERTTELSESNRLLQGSFDQLRRTQRDLLEASRRAGMADVATTILHNVGNVLNSVNVSSSLAADQVRRSKVAGLFKASKLLRDHQGDLGTFLTSDERGRSLLGYLLTLSDHLQEEQASLLQELESLQKNIDHIKAIVARQRENASRSSALLEPLRPGEIIDEAIDVVWRSRDCAGIDVCREYGETPVVMLDRHRILEIMVNLLKNAHESLADIVGDRRVTVRLRRDGPDRIAVQVEDTGCGMTEETLSKVFLHGFTTRSDGHGFGLHGSSCLAVEMGGSLTAESAGLTRGACFTMKLPLREELPLPVAAPSPQVCVAAEGLA